ncbi:MAG TPA: twin-arginine translocation signal domain-containing protein, partial [Leucothrix mucor]|nr:twin-arginine translocation signal domain-containing protein [Leucothrix mucor]
MPTMDKRTFLKLLALGTAGTATGALPFLMQN